MDIETERQWSAKMQELRKAHGVYGHTDPGGAQWFRPDGERLCRTQEMPGSARADYEAMATALGVGLEE